MPFDVLAAPAATLPALIFPTAMAAAAIDDLRRLKISNYIILALLLGFPIAAFAADVSLSDVVVYHLSVGLGVLGAFFFAFSRGWLGGGDVKLLSMIALWFGFTPQFAAFLIIGHLFGGVLALLVLAVSRRWFLPNQLLMFPWVDRIRHSGKVPFGIPLALGALTVYPQTPFFVAALEASLAAR